uniref:D-aminoacyl-tRNA deacylase n=1 Tax=Echinococcus granulosus TaxID=6210 RepID=A0A068X4V0_ECHGR|nr:hypothetical protein EgrG_002055600 [Echinococcus granulosus]
MHVFYVFYFCIRACHSSLTLLRLAHHQLLCALRTIHETVTEDDMLIVGSLNVTVKVRVKVDGIDASGN